MKQKVAKLVKGKEWYHQRFDGSPLFLYYMGSADVKSDIRKPKGTDGKIGVCFFSRGKADWYFDMGEIRRSAKGMIKLAKKDKDISIKLLGK
jgi:hypothetical protein